MNETQLKQVSELLKGFGFQLKDIQQSVTNFDNTKSDGNIKITFQTNIKYTPEIIL